MATAGFPSRRVTLALLWGVGLPVATAILVTAPRLVPHDLESLVWYAPGVVGLVGGAIAFRARPDNLAARRLVLFGLAGSSFNLSGFLLLELLDTRGPGPWLGPAAMLVHVLGLALAAALLSAVVVYPDGRYHRWYEAAAVRTVAALALLVPLAMLVARPTLEPPIFFEWLDGEAGAQATFPAITSPLHVSGFEILMPAFRAWLGLSFTMVPLLGAVLLGLRYRRFRAGKRLQIRWPMYGALAGLVLGIEGVLWQLTTLPGGVSSFIEITAMVVIVGSVVVGLVRPDLFDVDRAVRRTVVFIPLWLVIAAVYLGVAAALGLAVAGQGLEVAVVVAVAATVTFEPVRRATSARVVRWAYGETVDGEELVRQVGGALEHTHDVQALARAVAAAAREGLGVTWFRVVVAGSVTAEAGESASEEAVLRAELRHADVLLGEIACGPARRGRTPDPLLFETLARQTALAVHNARLAQELAASRTRLVAAEEAGRRRLERDIHDGAQQELVALIARIGLAQHQLRQGHRAQAETTLAELAGQAGDALENLRTLASGIHPAVLSDHGLVAALESRADAAPVPVVVRPGPGMRARRFAEEIEGTAYFVACEGLTNALKHACPGQVTIGLDVRGAELEVSVRDDGDGFDPRRAVPRRGLAGLDDRLHALGGRVEVDSRSGGGTCLRARLPVPAAATNGSAGNGVSAAAGSTGEVGAGA